MCSLVLTETGLHVESRKIGVKRGCNHGQSFDGIVNLSTFNLAFIYALVLRQRALATSYSLLQGSEATEPLITNIQRLG